MTAGRHTVRFIADNLASGTYIVKLTGPDSYITRKIVLIK
jgi:hypothetical protein